MEVPTFSDFLQDEMNRREWSQSDLARESGLSRQLISYILSGKSKSPDAETINKLALALNIPVEIVFRKAGLLPRDKEKVDEWALEVAAKIQKLPAEARNFIEHTIEYFYDMEKRQRK